MADSDSADFDGGRLSIDRVVNYQSADQFSSPDNGSQDDLTFQSARVAIIGTDVQVDGVSVGTLMSDGQGGGHLQQCVAAAESGRSHGAEAKA